MTRTMRILTFLLLMVVGTGHAWAEDEEYQFGHITYNGTAANDGGTLTFYTSSKDAEQGQNAVAPNGTGPTDLTDIMVRIDGEWESVGTGFFIKATPAVGHRLPNTEVGATVDFIQAEVVTSAQQAPSRRNAPDPTLEVGQTLPVKFYGYYYGLDGDPATEYYGLYYVVMPADANLSVSITATFPEVATNATAIDYVDVDGTTKSKTAGTVYVLDGTEARLGYGSYNNRTEHETWYVCNKDLTYTNGLEFYGKVHLILADGKTMTYDGTETFINGYGTLDIYGQGGITEGAISAKTTAESCINVYGNLTINGGIVSAESTHETTISCYGIRVDGTLTINRGIVSGKSKYDGISGTTITINGGTVSGTGSDFGIYCTAIPTGVLLITGGHVCGVGDKYGIGARGDINITGGQIEATGGTDEDCAGMSSGDGDIILGWTNPTDYILANSYYVKTGQAVKTVDGKALKFTDGNNIVKLIGDITDLDAIKNQKLTPYGIGGYCGTDDTETTDVDESKTLTWDIALKDEPTSATDLATTLTIEGCGTMASYTTEAPAPWSDKTIEAANILASADVANVNAIAENIPVTLGYTGPVATTHTFNGYFVRKTADNTNISADVLSHNDQTKVWTLTMPDYAVNVSPKLTRNTTVSVEIVDPVTTIDGHPLIISGDDAHVKVTLNPVAGEGENNLPKINGIVKIFVGSKDYTVAIVNGEGHYYVTNFAQDAYAITASFAGDANHAASTSATTTLEVCKILTEITCSLNETSINVGESLDVTVKINEVGLQRPVIDEATNKKKEYKYASSTPLSVDAVVTIKAGTEYDRQQLEIIPNYENNNYTFGFTGGQGTKIFSHLPAGTRYFRAVYAGDDKFTQSECQNKTLIVNKKATTIGVDVTSPVIAK